ncbi:hypothetical protein GGS26DRAFT_587865 [Hypomontagnella submonticulosa]|nr:hypothetical protein GGS26DRAFT_587865 [Hypomontagnella submonticulosa]
MRASSSIAAVALLSRGALAQCADGLAILANNEVAETCAPSVSSDAAALCNSYLAAVTTIGAPSETAMETTTVFSTRTVTKVLFTTTVTTETEIIVSTASTTVFATASPGPIGRRELLGINALYPTLGETSSSTSDVTTLSAPTAGACPTLTSLPTESVSSSAISSACGCLGVSPSMSTVSADATATSTVTESRTTVTTTTVTSTIKTYTKSTTTTVVAMATETVAYDRCSVGYSSGGNGQGNRPENVPASSSQDCCQQCQLKQNCVASAYTGTTCQHLIKVAQLSSAATSDRCPLGVEDYAFGPVGGMVYPGPCGY